MFCTKKRSNTHIKSSKSSNFSDLKKKLKWIFLKKYKQLKTNKHSNIYNMSFNSQLSIYIPRVFPNWRNATKMTTVFENLDIGRIRRIDFVDKETAKGVKFSQAFIHFYEWFDNNHTRNLQKRIEDVDDTAKIVYDDPWFWMVFKNTNPLTEGEMRLHERIAEMEKTHAQEQENNQYWIRTLLSQVGEQDKSIGLMWNHCRAKGMQSDAMLHADELLEEMNLQYEVDACIDDAERTHREFESAMENLGRRSEPIEISDDGSSYADMPDLESDYNRTMPTRQTPQTPAPAPRSCPSTPRNNVGVQVGW